MTEIPEHLLKRSRERRSAIGQGDDEAPAASGASSTPATTAPAATPATAAAPSGPAPRGAAPAPVGPPPPKPDPVYVAAAKRRKKIPFWAMATLSLMPVWAFMYVRSITESAEVVAGPLGVGTEVYSSSCASCHGATGGGGAGYALNNGSVEATFPHIEDQIRYVYYGTDGYNAAGIEIYGNPDREGGPHVTGGMGPMPAWGSQLTQAEIVGVICHERYTLGGADPTSDQYAAEFDTWCSEDAPAYQAVDSGDYDFTSPEGEMFGDVEVMPVGPEAVAGSAPG